MFVGFGIEELDTPLHDIWDVDTRVDLPPIRTGVHSDSCVPQMAQQGVAHPYLKFISFPSISFPSSRAILEAVVALIVPLTAWYFGVTDPSFVAESPSAQVVGGLSILYTIVCLIKGAKELLPNLISRARPPRNLKLVASSAPEPATGPIIVQLFQTPGFLYFLTLLVCVIPLLTIHTYVSGNIELARLVLENDQIELETRKLKWQAGLQLAETPVRIVEAVTRVSAWKSATDLVTVGMNVVAGFTGGERAPNQSKLSTSPGSLWQGNRWTSLIGVASKVFGIGVNMLG